MPSAGRPDNAPRGDDAPGIKLEIDLSETLHMVRRGRSYWLVQEEPYINMAVCTIRLSEQDVIALRDLAHWFVEHMPQHVTQPVERTDAHL